MKDPLFSVVIPTYNRADLVRQAAVSVIHQSLDDVEVVVSDNLSTDETRDVVRALDDPRVRYVQPAPSHGAARPLGVRPGSRRPGGS